MYLILFFSPSPSATLNILEVFLLKQMILSDSTRVSNELGAGNFDKAKTAMFATLKLSVLLPLLVVLALAFGHNTWSSFFINNITIMDEFSSMVPFLAISITLDSVQGAYQVRC